MGLDAPPVLDDNFSFMYKTKDSFYYRTQMCVDLNTEFGHLYVDICEREQQICDKLMDHIHERLADIQYAIRYCGKLDCIMAMATFATKFNLVKPQLVTNRKTLTVKNGRHILLDLRKKFIPNDTAIDVEQKNLINILIAPNGKFYYSKVLWLL